MITLLTFERTGIVREISWRLVVDNVAVQSGTFEIRPTIVNVATRFELDLVGISDPRDDPATILRHE